MDLKSVLVDAGISPPRAPLRLPRIDEALAGAEIGQSNMPAASPSAKPTGEVQEIWRLDVADQFVQDSIRDNAVLDLEFLDGTRLCGTPTAIGLYSLRLRANDDSEFVVFKHGLRALRRHAAAGPGVSRKRPPAHGKARQARGKLKAGRSAKRA